VRGEWRTTAGGEPGEGSRLVSPGEARAAPFASEAITQVTPIVCEREFTPAAEALEPVVRAAHAATPRAPPRG